MSRRKRADRRGVEMAACGLKISAKVLNDVAKYAEARDISRNAAFEELICITLYGKDSVTTTVKHIEEALTRVAFKSTTAG